MQLGELTINILTIPPGGCIAKVFVYYEQTKGEVATDLALDALSLSALKLGEVKLLPEETKLLSKVEQIRNDCSFI